MKRMRLVSVSVLACTAASTATASASTAADPLPSSSLSPEYTESRCHPTVITFLASPVRVVASTLTPDEMPSVQRCRE